MVHLLYELDSALQEIKSGVLTEDEFVAAVDQITSHYRKEYNL